METALDGGAEDFLADDNGFEIITAPASFEAVHKKIEARGIKPASASVTELPTSTVPVQDPQVIAAINRLVEALEDHDDVKEVYTNAEFSE
jgi:transcriptional/translational regulatory protein YebC/TACO1